MIAPDARELCLRGCYNIYAQFDELNNKNSYFHSLTVLQLFRGDFKANLPLHATHIQQFQLYGATGRSKI